METVIRYLKREELDQAASVFVDSFNSVGEMWNHEIALKHLEEAYDPEYSFGAFVDGKMVAIMITNKDYLTDHEELCIDILAVSPSYQGKKIGKSLLSKIEEFAKEKGLDAIWLQSSTKLPSYDFYMRNGFNPTNWVVIYKSLK